MFHVGQKVVCIAPNNSWDFFAIHHPKCGAIYTIRDTEWDEFLDLPYVRLAELQNPTQLMACSDGTTMMTEIRFSAWAFRPVYERKTNISIFTRMLDDHREKV